MALRLVSPGRIFSFAGLPYGGVEDVIYVDVLVLRESAISVKYNLDVSIRMSVLEKGCFFWTSN